jgi:hypothetical protein
MGTDWPVMPTIRQQSRQPQGESVIGTFYRCRVWEALLEESCDHSAAALAILALSPASYSQNATKAVLDIQVWVTTETLHEGPYSLQGN